MILRRTKDVIPAYLTGRMAQHSAASLAVKLFAIGCGFLFAVFVARTLGARGYGIVAFAISVATVCSTLALLGINGLAVRAVAALRTQDNLPAIRSFVAWACWTVLFASVVVGILVALASIVGGPYRTALLISACSVPVLAQLNLHRGLTQGNGKVVEAQVPLDVVRWLTTLSILGAAIAMGVALTAPEVLAIVVISLIVSQLVAYFLLHQILAGTPVAREATERQRWMKDSLPFLGIALLGIVGTEINTLLLGILAGPREAGLYQPIARLAPIMMLAREAIDMPLAPRIVQLWESSDLERLRQLVRRSALACTAATVAISAAVLIASPYIFAAFGPEFEAYRGYLYWIAAAQIVNAALSPAPLLLTMVGSMKARVQAQVATLVVQAGLALVLVPWFGAAGAVVSLTSAIIVWSILHWSIAWRTTGIDTSVFSRWRNLRRSQP